MSLPFALPIAHGCAAATGRSYGCNCLNLEMTDCPCWSVISSGQRLGERSTP